MGGSGGFRRTCEGGVARGLGAADGIVGASRVGPDAKRGRNPAAANVGGRDGPAEASADAAVRANAVLCCVCTCVRVCVCACVRVCVLWTNLYEPKSGEPSGAREFQVDVVVGGMRWWGPPDPKSV